MCSAVSPASPKISDSAIVKQPAWAAPISSSGFVPGFPSKRLAKPYGYLSSAPLFVEIAPLPSLMPPSQTAAPSVITFHLSLGFGQRHCAEATKRPMTESDVEERAGIPVRAAAAKQI